MHWSPERCRALQLVLPARDDRRLPAGARRRIARHRRGQRRRLAGRHSSVYAADLGERRGPCPGRCCDDSRSDEHGPGYQCEASSMSHASLLRKLSISTGSTGDRPPDPSGRQGPSATKPERIITMTGGNEPGPRRDQSESRSGNRSRYRLSGNKLLNTARFTIVSASCGPSQQIQQASAAVAVAADSTGIANSWRSA